MNELTLAILQIIGTIYLFLMYTFLFLGCVEFLFGKHSPGEKFKQVVAYLITPFLFPVALILWVGWVAMRFVLGMTIILLFSVAAVLYMINAHLPSGGLIKGWLKASRWMLAKARELLDTLSVFQIPMTFIKPLQPARQSGD